MSTEPAPTSDPDRPTDATTAVAARGRPDPWTASDNGEVASVTARAPRQFEPLSFLRLRNLMDDANAYCQ